ncbi:MAG: R3H domain-containing nucleic acid-binding protein [candidate division KSB1 bacterium]|nr:R3H domain-containing nucleic acid-binding protein [candidate division KSB1 bacterium]
MIDKRRNPRERNRRHQPGKGRERNDQEKPEKIVKLIDRIKSELSDTIEPIVIPNLNAFERKCIHREFDRNPEIVTKTYRYGEDYELRVVPVGNLKRFAKKKADEAIENRDKVVLPPMTNYERFVVHSTLKDLDTIKTSSHGEGEFRHIEIEPEMFGRGLKRIIKKIKLM